MTTDCLIRYNSSIAFEEGRTNMSYKDLISLDYTFEVDTSNLDTALDDIRSQIAGIVSAQDDLDVSSAVSNELDNVLEERIDNDLAQRNYVSEDDFDSKVEDVLSSGSYVTEYDVDEKLREAIDDSTPDDDAVRAIVESVTDGRLHKLDQRIDEVDNEADNRIGSLANLIGDANKRVEALEARLASFEADTPLTPRVEALEAKLDSGDVGQALTFFGLLKQAFAALR